MRRTQAITVLLLHAGAALAQEGGNSPTNSPPPEPLKPSETAEDAATAAAREAFRAGALHAHEKRWSDALEAFRRSAALRPHPVTTYDVGYCEKELGHVTRARKALRAALTETDAGGASLPEKYRVEAVRYLEGLERRLARLAVNVPSSVDRVVVDSRPLEPERVGDKETVYLAGTAETDQGGPTVSGRMIILLDPGTHVVVGTRGGAPQASMTVDASPGAVLTIHFLQDPTPAPVVSAVPADAPQGPRWDRIAGFSALGIGAAALVTGGVFGALAIAKKNDIDDTGDCTKVASSTQCPPNLQSEVDSLHFFSNAATVSFILGGVGVVTGAAVLFFSPPAASRPASKVAVEPWLGVERVGVRGAF